MFSRVGIRMRNTPNQFNFAGNRMPAKDITVYAKWNETPVIRFDSAGGSEVKEIAGKQEIKSPLPPRP